MAQDETLKAQLVKVRTRAIAQQRTATFDRTLWEVFGYGTPFFAALGSTTFFVTFLVVPGPLATQLAGLCALIAAIMATWSKVRDLDQSQRDHREAASKFEEIQTEISVRLAGHETRAITEDEAIELGKRMTDLDAKTPAAPNWIYRRAERDVKRGATA